MVSRDSLVGGAQFCSLLHRAQPLVFGPLLECLIRSSTEEQGVLGRVQHKV